ncbi:MAG: hypothetical protein QGH45_15405, partial [Myxococcota bacterium]|nr:hypothetical protein [Myxococcota bacterium]
RFVVATNAATEEVRAEISGFPAGTLDIEVVGEARTLPPGGGAIEETFDPLEVHLYRAVLEP